MRFPRFSRVENLWPRLEPHSALAFLSTLKHTIRCPQTRLRNLLVTGLLFLAASLTAAAQIRDPAAQSFQRGQQRLQKEDFDGAIADFTKVIALSVSRDDETKDSVRFDAKADAANRNPITLVSPLVAAAYGGRGFARYRKGRLTEALTDCDRALSLNPGLTQVYNNRGIVRWVTGDLDGALADFN